MNLKRLIIWSIIGTGISSVTTQILTIREFLTQFSGNEITISLVIFCWLLMTGIGALAAKLMKGGGLKVYAPLILIVAIWPLLQITGIRGLREVFFIHGISPGFYPILLYILRRDHDQVDGNGNPLQGQIDLYGLLPFGA